MLDHGSDVFFYLGGTAVVLMACSTAGNLGSDSGRWISARVLFFLRASVHVYCSAASAQFGLWGPFP
jgi:hypothetical protein